MVVVLPVKTALIFVYVKIVEMEECTVVADEMTMEVVIGMGITGIVIK